MSSCNGKCSCGDNHQHHHKEETEPSNILNFFRFLLAILFFTAGFFFKNYEIILFGIAWLVAGYDVLINSFNNLKSLKISQPFDLFDEFLLMSIATIGAFLIREYEEGAAVMIFYQLGEIVQNSALGRSKKAISKLMDLRPNIAHLVEKSGTIDLSPENVGINQKIEVRPGEKIPLDGKITQGFSMVDTKALTGESLPVIKKPGDEVLSGTLVLDGVLIVLVTKSFENSAFSKIIEMVENASEKKAKTEKFIRKFAKYYTPSVVFLALILAVIPPIILGENFSTWIYRALVFLVISCPCALILSVPLGFFAGIGACSKEGILIKGGSYLEALGNVGSVVFDKTGTLTKGIFTVFEISSNGIVSEEKVLEYAAYAESYSNHPLALSIIERYKQPILKEKITKFNEIAGHGIKAEIDGHQITVGNHHLMELEKIDFKTGSDKIYSEIFVAVDGIFAGAIRVGDEIKEDSAETVRELQKRNIAVTMLTGDSFAIAGAVAKKLGILSFKSELLPGEKSSELEKIIKNSVGSKVLFAGDGINDAPVIARSDIGIAMGGIGSDAAIEASDIVILNDSPLSIIKALEIAKKTKIIVIQNISLAFSIKIFVLILGASGFASLWAAVFADVGVALLALFNSLRILKR